LHQRSSAARLYYLTKTRWTTRNLRAAGRGRETRAIEFPDPAQRITYHPCAAPLHRVRTDDMLPVKLLTPFQAENDHHIKDTYNYVTVQVSEARGEAGGVAYPPSPCLPYPK
jgi:protein arginine N-methyltransferase 7